MDEVVNRYKQSRDTGALNGGRKNLESEHRALTNEIAGLQARLKAEGSDLAEKVQITVIGFKVQKWTWYSTQVPLKITWWLY